MLFFTFGYVWYSYITGIPTYTAKRLFTPRNYFIAYKTLAFRERTDCVMLEIIDKIR